MFCLEGLASEWMGFQIPQLASCEGTGGGLPGALLFLSTLHVLACHKTCHATRFGTAIPCSKFRCILVTAEAVAQTCRLDSCAMGITSTNPTNIQPPRLQSHAWGHLPAMHWINQQSVQQSQSWKQGHWKQHVWLCCQWEQDISHQSDWGGNKSEQRNCRYCG